MSEWRVPRATSRAGAEEAGAGEMCQAARIVAVGFVGRKRLQRLTGLPALDTDHRHTASGQAVMEHRGHTAGLEHDPSTGRPYGPDAPSPPDRMRVSAALD